ncbi:MAG: ion transporter [Colwellia sp.]|nr:ion transporter [Colwellia sp.]MCW9083117.1 ion transporter [Colwellia sp.]
MSESSTHALTTTSLRARVYQLLENETNRNITAKIVNLLLIVLIITNVIAAIFESEADYHQLYQQEFYLFEVISLSIFCIEYLLRVWCSVEDEKYQASSNIKARLRYMMTPMAIIDLIAILPFIIALFFAVDLRALRLLRVLRLLKLTHYFKGFNIFISVINKELKSITAAMTVMMFLIIIAASLMHSVEGSIQPEAFGSIIQSFWWAVVTMTTVGYGDVVPVTSIGKIISTFIMLIGVGLVALPAGMLAARFGEELRERRKNLNAHIKDALSSGYIDNEQYQALEQLADKLEIEPRDLQRSINLLKQGHHGNKCPHCGK